MDELNGKVDELASIMAEFGLEKAKLSGDGWAVELAIEPETRAVAAAPVAPSPTGSPKSAAKPKASPKPSGPTGIPVTSPMTGIYYASSSPGSPPFAKEGEAVQAGQVVGLIEAMKVFNEITAPVSGVVSKVAIKNGDLVQPGDAILYIG
ncbi:MAG: biotin/lipoyl-binding protein [Armatimonadetes bacterium]|nr:biotin/lipoyl-binding protein [Armatimonadota bacterium]MBS1712036.1 biotin/lipoyl-binding protein [Armatimonadota bacterium]MBX3109410.1 biotin/lipoyl-binding protein [Fimbriimonadaceae bacterium]